MGSKAKIRFLADIDRIPFQVASVFERSNGELLVSIYSKNSIIDGIYFPITDRHISIHRNDGGKNTTITFKTKMLDGSVNDSVTIIKDTIGNLIWPIFSWRIGVPQIDRRTIPKVREKDIVIDIGKFTSSKANMICTFFVIDPNIKFQIKSGLFNFFQYDFSHYSILALVSYINAPSLPNGNFTISSTTLPIRTLGAKSPFRIERESLKLKDIEGQHYFLSTHQINRLIDSVIGSFDEENRDLFISISRIITSEPWFY